MNQILDLNIKIQQMTQKENIAFSLLDQQKTLIYETTTFLQQI